MTEHATYETPRQAGPTGGPPGYTSLDEWQREQYARAMQCDDPIDALTRRARGYLLHALHTLLDEDYEAGTLTRWPDVVSLVTGLEAIEALRRSRQCVG